MMREPTGAIVLDVETTMKCPIGNNKASPFWPENKVVLWGLTEACGDEIQIADNMAFHDDDTDLLIGHNIAFDLLHALKDGAISRDNLARRQIWDTQLAEYLLTGQTNRYPTLDECASKYGGTLKDSKVSDMFAAGYGAEDVPRNMLEDYLEADLKNTRLVFQSQYDDASTRGMLPLLWSQMDARLATIEMVNNGLAIDKVRLDEGAAQLELECEALHEAMLAEAKLVTGFPLDPAAPQQLAKVLFGGTFTVPEKHPNGTYKNGKPKFKTVDVNYPVPNLNYVAKPEWVGKNGVPSTSDAVLQELRGATTHPLINCVLTYREKSKQLNTYFKGIDALIMPDGLLHHNLNHCVTATGRLSSSEPNLQNVTNGKEGTKGGIKECFVSRWGQDGVIIEADYSQLEMVMLAVRTGDARLIDDIRRGVDMHTALYHSMYGRNPSKAERKGFKPAAFALVYGAGATGIAGQTGMSVPEAKRFIATFYARYPMVKAWHDSMIKHVESHRISTGEKDKATGLPVGRSTYVCPMSGRNYSFKEYPLDPIVAKWKGKDVGFSPTEIKNYPVQGGATGDIVPLVLGKLFRVLRNNHILKDNCLLINTVHDSVMFDCHRSVLDTALHTIKRTMEAAPDYVWEEWKFKFELQLKVGLSYGPTWADQAEVDKDFFNSKEAA